MFGLLGSTAFGAYVHPTDCTLSSGPSTYIPGSPNSGTSGPNTGASTSGAAGNPGALAASNNVGSPNIPPTVASAFASRNDVILHDLVGVGAWVVQYAFQDDFYLRADATIYDSLITTPTATATATGFVYDHIASTVVSFPLTATAVTTNVTVSASTTITLTTPTNGMIVPFGDWTTIPQEGGTEAGATANTSGSASSWGLSRSSGVNGALSPVTYILLSWVDVW